MESYIEITWISGFLILLNATTLAFYLSAKPCAFYKLVLYSGSIPLAATLIFHRYEWLMMALLEGYFFWYIYRDAWKSWLLMIAHRLLWNFTCYIFYEGSFHLGIYFAPCEKIPYVLWAILLISWMGMFFHWKLTLSQQNFIYPLQIKTSKAIIKVKGYLDSGNLMMEEGIPVLFLDAKYEEYFQGETIEWVMMNTMQGNGKVQCYCADAKVAESRYHRVLIHLNKSMELPLGANALLNIHMMTQE